jgi:uncharacterized membrane protein YciS (DUF1049 family)
MYIEERKVIEMSELLFFVLGFIIGGLAMTTLMCCLQVNRISELERQIVLRDNEHEEDSEVVKCEVVE